MVLVVHVQRVGKLLKLTVHIWPQRHGLTVNLLHNQNGMTWVWANHYAHNSNMHLFLPSRRALARCCRETSRTGSCRGDRAPWRETAHWIQTQTETMERKWKKCIIICPLISFFFYFFPQLHHPLFPHLSCHLPDAVDELHKERWAFRVCMISISMSYTLRQTEERF